MDFRPKNASTSNELAAAVVAGLLLATGGGERLFSSATAEFAFKLCFEPAGEGFDSAAGEGARAEGVAEEAGSGSESVSVAVRNVSEAAGVEAEDASAARGERALELPRLPLLLEAVGFLLAGGDGVSDGAGAELEAVD